MRRAVVIGKFYPLHKGHQYLIETAILNSDHLTAIVCQTKEEVISGSTRVEWIKQIYPNVKVILISCDGLDQDDSKLWANLTLKWLGFKPDVVFTSEIYGENYAKFMECEHVLVDVERKKFSISGTKVRSNPFKYWDYLHLLVRAYFVKRVCIVGAESTGTTTLSKDLAKYYKTCWVPEYGRIYAEAKIKTLNFDKWTTDEFVHIAQIQNLMEDSLVKKANKVLICDTNSWATGVWHQRYMGKSSKEVANLSVGRKYDLYLVTDIDIPFVQDKDGTRDGEHIRGWMHKQFIEIFKNKKEEFFIISGSRKKRLSMAIKHINHLLSK